jgi:diketogulonate reductase-like aldo/keto reductase
MRKLNVTTVPARDGVKHNPSGLGNDTSVSFAPNSQGETVECQNRCAAPPVLPCSSRRSWFGQTLSLGVAAGLGQWAMPASAQTPQHTSGAGLLARPIPSTGELLPAVGLGSWITFNVGNDSVARDASTEVVRAFFAGGGRLIDSSPMYGSSQPTIGYALAKLGQPKALFSAEKVWIGDAGQGAAQLEASRTFWGVPRFDLVQVHNLLAWREHLPRLLERKAAGQLRYVGITTSEGRRHGDIEQVMRTQPIDFVQLSYNLLDREAEARLLPLAQDRGIAVIVNRPFREGALLAQLRRHRLPGWATELGCDGWAQVALKFIVSHPAVTCAIPATSQVAHVRQNLGAMRGPMPDAALRKRMASEVAAL